MASEDLGKGYGELNPSLKDWRCPDEQINYPIENWQVVLSEIKGVKMSGRKCPNCEFKAYQLGDTRRMHPVFDTYEKAVLNVGEMRAESKEIEAAPAVELEIPQPKEEVPQ